MQLIVLRINKSFEFNELDLSRQILIRKVRVRRFLLFSRKEEQSSHEVDKFGNARGVDY